MAERFWPKVRRGARCWEWMAAKRVTGYGMIAVGNGRCRSAHRVAWELTFGPVPQGLCVLHHCDNPGCVRPDHLFLGTQLENVADMMAKGRGHRGERSGLSKLTEREVAEMRALRKDGVGVREIGRRFGVGNATASVVTRGLTWRHVE